jgi:hypothetical protein
MLDPGKRRQVSLEVYWRAAALDLALELEAPFSIQLPSGATVNAVGRLGHFGARHGMIIVSDFAALRAHLVELKTLGFGFSAMTDPTDPYEREGCLDVLRDWGWSGDAHNSPQWL